jgi:hypothetical protein
MNNIGWKNLFLVSVVFLAINFFYFHKMFVGEGLLYFNDFAPPVSLEHLSTYLSSTDLINSNSNLGYVRLNFFNEIPVMFFIWLISQSFSYEDAVVLLYIFGFLLTQIISYFIFYKISRNVLVSFVLALLSVFNLWSYDRIQQGHYFNLILFFPISLSYLYVLFLTHNIKVKKFVIPILLLTSFFTYYHFTFILIYITLFKFIFDCFFYKNRYQVFMEYFWYGLLSLPILSVFIFPYAANYLSFKALSASVSTTDTLQLFSWQSMSISTLFLLRTGMQSFQLLNQFILPLYLVGILALFFLALPLWTKEEPRVKLPLYSSFTFLGFLSFAWWVNPVLVSYIYKIPTMSTFRDMNKFTGIFFIILLFLVALNSRSVKYIQYIIFFACLSLVPFMAPYKLFTKLDSDERFILKVNIKLNLS